jgi:hypothetical protein
MLTTNQPLQAATRPLAGSGAGALLCGGVLAGSIAGDVAVIRVRPRLPWAAAAASGAGSASARSGYKSAIRTQFEHKTQFIDPVAPGGLGSHPVREPEPA